MIRLIIISVLVLVSSNGVFGRSQCSDCILFRSCPRAVRLSEESPRDAALIVQNQQSVCGSESVDGVNMPKICCSDFDVNDNRFGDLDSSNDDIEKHPNVALLPESCGPIDGNRIVGGNISSLYEYPWMTLISHRTRGSTGKDNLQFKCGGSIINERYILTAAHCVVNKKIAGVRIGEFDISTKEDCQGEYPHITCESRIQDMSVEESIPHENYKRVSVDNDIALLRLKRPINLSFKNAKPICLPIGKNLINLNIRTGGKIATVAGWGVTENLTESDVLRKVNIPIMTAETCRNFYNKLPGNSDATANKLCAGEISKDSCSGDSGGPLMLEDEVNGIYRIIQYGVVSFGPRQCGSLFPGVYTDVTKYMKWILDHIKP